MKEKRKSTIFQRIFFPLLVVAIVQIALLYVVFHVSGVYSSFDENARELLIESTRNKYQSLQNEMINEWTSFGNLEDVIDDITQKELTAEGKDWEDIHTDAALNEAIIEQTSDELIDRLRKTKTTGIFLILDGVGVQGESDTYAGIYLRNRDPGTETTDNSDLGLLRGLPPVSRQLGISLESFWQATFRFEEGRDNPENAFFFNPLDAAKETGIRDSKNCCYWSHPTKMGVPSDITVITYTVPLISKNGEVYGVLGVELNTRYIISQIYGNTVGTVTDRNYYIGTTTDGGKTYTEILNSDNYYNLKEISAIDKTEGNQNWMIRAKGSDDDILYGSVFPLKLYSNNAPFSEEQWVLIGFQEKESLYTAGNHFRRLMLMGFISILFLDIFVAVGASYGISYPIRMLEKILSKNKDYQELEFPTTKVIELDTLADAITDMNHGIIEGAKRTSRLIELSGLPVGVYEIKKNAQNAYCSDGFFQLLRCEELKNEQNLLDAEKLGEILCAVTGNPLDDDTYIVEEGEQTRYLRIITQEDEGGSIGTILDVTKEIEDRQRIERERDFDTLTSIWNRRAFEYHLEHYFKDETEKLGVAAMVMFDLDNLKSINDAYGHDCGDLYIRTFAMHLGKFMSDHCIVARRSGDEFYLFIYGCKTREEVMAQINDCWVKVNDQTMVLPDQSKCKVRVSAGYAWYPDDATTPQQLIHYADFAMYYAKQTLKGTLKEFDIRDYNQESFLFNGHEALNRLIDYHLVNFVFQPIVSAHTGNLYGYELLMRSEVDELKSPDTILRMAKSQGKLNHIEKITWFEGLAAVRKGMEDGHIDPEAKLFVNSIANQSLSNDEILELRHLFGDLFSRIVLEVTEGESNDQELTKRKLRSIEQTGGMIAIDDYGTGYNSELALVMIPAQIVKIDMTFVRGVNFDTDKQLIIKNLITFARRRNIEVLAEGVETKAEMEMLMSFGIDYFQGYYIGKPKYVPEINAGVQDEIRRLSKSGQ